MIYFNVKTMSYNQWSKRAPEYGPDRTCMWWTRTRVFFVSCPRPDQSNIGSGGIGSCSGRRCNFNLSLRPKEYIQNIFLSARTTRSLYSRTMFLRLARWPPHSGRGKFSTIGYNFLEDITSIYLLVFEL